MCLTITSGPHKATKDLYTLKRVINVEQNYFHTPFQYFTMYYNEVYTSKLRKVVSSGLYLYRNSEDIIEEGFHSLVASKLLKGENLTWINRDFDDMCSLSRRAVVVCKIPKGSIYYLGENCDIASNKLQPLWPVLVNNNCLERNIIPTEGEVFEALGKLSDCLDWLKDAIEVCKSYGIKLM